MGNCVMWISHKHCLNEKRERGEKLETTGIETVKEVFCDGKAKKWGTAGGGGEGKCFALVV